MTNRKEIPATFSESRRRMNICRACPKMVKLFKPRETTGKNLISKILSFLPRIPTEFCRVCKCWLNLKTKIKRMHCPDGLW